MTAGMGAGQRQQAAALAFAQELRAGVLGLQAVVGDEAHPVDHPGVARRHLSGDGMPDGGVNPVRPKDDVPRGRATVFKVRRGVRGRLFDAGAAGAEA